MSLNRSIKALETASTVRWFPCGDGQMPLRYWSSERGAGSDTVVLLHGGSGSWLHWFRNIEALRQQFNVVAVDLPGLGDAAMCPIESDAHSAAEVTLEALSAGIDGDMHIVAFSWGCTITATIMKALQARHDPPQEGPLVVPLAHYPA